MKLKDKKIEIMGVGYISNKYGNRKKETVTIATVWAYFRQLSGDEYTASQRRRLKKFYSVSITTLT